MHTPFVVGLVGEKGSGKGTLTGLLRAGVAPQSVATVRFSDIPRETLAAWDTPATRAHLQDLVMLMVQRYGEDVLACAVRKRVLGLDADVVVLDGIRWAADAAVLRSFPRHMLVYVTAPVDVRYARICARGENAGERVTPLEQFLAEEQAQNERAIPDIGATADLRIDNVGTLDDYRAAMGAIQRHLVHSVA